MKLPKVAHLLSIVIGIAGAVCLIGAWAAGEGGRHFFRGFASTSLQRRNRLAVDHHRHGPMHARSHAAREGQPGLVSGCLDQ